MNLAHLHLLLNPGTIGSRVNASIEYVVTGSNRLVWPVLEVFHFVGLALLLGATVS